MLNSLKEHSEEIEYNKILKNLDNLEQSVEKHYTHLFQLEKTLETICHNKLTEKQRTILKWLSVNKECKTIYTNLICRLSEELEIPKSTLRWNLKGLREAGMIKAGDKNNKGLPVELTTKGKIMASISL
jgi:DNA-binding transcriptional ArsR family regulator